MIMSPGSRPSQGIFPLSVSNTPTTSIIPPHTMRIFPSSVMEPLRIVALGRRCSGGEFPNADTLAPSPVVLVAFAGGILLGVDTAHRHPQSCFSPHQWPLQ